MTTPREFFLEESQQLLERMRSAIADGWSAENAREFHRACRGLRGSAQMAREERVLEGARLLEAAARELTEGRLTWDDRVDRHTRATVDHLWTLVEEGDADIGDAEVLEQRARLRERWESLGVPVDPDAETESRRAQGSAARRAQEEQVPPVEFRAFVAGELTEIAAEIDSALSKLSENPDDRSAHSRVLDRQKPLLGAAGLDWFPAVLDALQTLEAAAEAAVSGRPPSDVRSPELYRAVREVLRESIPYLQRGEAPPSSGPAVDRLRRLRTRSRDGAPPSFGGPLVPLDDLHLKGEAAYRRILELRPTLERAVVGSPESRRAVEELYDLLRLAMK